MGFTTLKTTATSTSGPGTGTTLSSSTSSATTAKQSSGAGISLNGPVNDPANGLIFVAFSVFAAISL